MKEAFDSFIQITYLFRGKSAADGTGLLGAKVNWGVLISGELLSQLYEEEKRRRKS